MNAVRRALEFYENINPDEARRAWLEFEVLLANSPQHDPTALVQVGGAKQPLIEEMELVPEKWSERECKPIPFVTVEKKGNNIFDAQSEEL